MVEGEGGIMTDGPSGGRFEEEEEEDADEGS